MNFALASLGSVYDTAFSPESGPRKRTIAASILKACGLIARSSLQMIFWLGKETYTWSPWLAWYSAAGMPHASDASLANAEMCESM